MSAAAWANGYALVRSGSVEASEVERADADVVDVILSWGEGADRTVLAVKHLEPGASLTLGEGEGCDLAVPANVLGAERVRVLAGKSLVAPAGARLRVDGWPAKDGRAELARGQVGELQMGAFTLRVALVAAPKTVPLAMRIGRALLGIVGASALAHVALVAIASSVAPSLGAADADTTRDQYRLMQAQLDATIDPDQKKPDDVDGPSDPSGTATSTAAPGDPGQIGRKDLVDAHGRIAIAGDKSLPPELNRAQQIQEAKSFGMLALLGTLSDPTGGPSSPWGRDLNGHDDQTALGNLFTGDIGDGSGAGGLTLSGIGEGGGQPGGWIGMRGIGDGTFGHCTAARCGDGISDGRGPGHGTHVVTAPVFHYSTTSVNGRLPPEIIQRVVRQRDGAFRLCYANGLRANPNLTGRVAVSFLIDRNGSVSYAGDAGSDLPDTTVRSCIVSTFYGLSFPAPDGGTVRVQYGFNLSPGQS